MTIKKNLSLIWFFSMKKENRKIWMIRMIFDIESWLWKSEIAIFGSPNLEGTLVYPFLWKSAMFHPIKLPFNAEAAGRILKVVYLQCYIFFLLYYCDSLLTWMLLHLFFLDRVAYDYYQLISTNFKFSGQKHWCLPSSSRIWEKSWQKSEWLLIMFSIIL